MGRSVIITTPIPTLEEVGKRLKMSKARQQRLIEIVRGSGNGQSPERHRNSPGSLDGRFHNDRLARELLAGQEGLTLTDRDSATFFDALVHPPKPNARLRRAFSAAWKRVVV